MYAIVIGTKNKQSVTITKQLNKSKKYACEQPVQLLLFSCQYYSRMKLDCMLTYLFCVPCFGLAGLFVCFFLFVLMYLLFPTI